MTNESKPLGVVVEFIGDVEFTDGESIQMTPSRPSKSEALTIGCAYYEAIEDEQDAMLEDFGPVLIRRSLRAFANYAKRTAQPEVAEVAESLRGEIRVVAEARAS